jgi:Domain of unknown function (DUF4158)
MHQTPDRRPVSGDPWRLTEEDRTLVVAKPQRARLGFAVLLLFFRAHGRFPRTGMEIAPTCLARVARQLGVVPPASARRIAPARTLKRYRAEIRARFGTRQATVRDADDLTGWLRDHVVATTRDIADLASGLEAQCRTLGLEPPSTHRARRIARSAVRAYDEQFCARIHGHLSLAVRGTVNLSAEDREGWDAAGATRQLRHR